MIADSASTVTWASAGPGKAVIMEVTDAELNVDGDFLRDSSGIRRRERRIR
jgi:hypothetical protein